jgi:transposase
MLCVETIGKIRRRRLIHQDTISGIARDLGLSRNTVKKALRSGAEPFEYRRKRQPRPRLGPYLKLLDEWLEAEAKLPLRERRTAQRLYEALQLQGYAGAIDSVRRHLKRYRERTKPVSAFIPQVFAPGEAYQFDWSHEKVELGGAVQVLKVAHLRLCHSRAFHVAAYPRESQEMVFDAHARAFAFLGGVARRGIYDNMKTAVDAIFVGKERRYNQRFLAMCSHYLIEPTACNPASGWEKGQIEKQVGSVRSWLFTPMPRFDDLASLNAYLEQRCCEIAQSRRHPVEVERTIGEVWAEERRLLQPMPAPFDGFHERVCRVSSTALVSFERNRYSVDCRYAGQTVALRAYANKIVIFADGAIIGEHARHFARYQTVYNPWHYVPALEHKPGALRNGAPFKDWNLPGAMTRVRERLAKHLDGDRQFVEILSMVALYGLDTVANACAAALEDSVVSSAHVINWLHRAVQVQRPALIQVPEALRLRHEPLADCARYDRLRTAANDPNPPLKEVLCKPN